VARAAFDPARARGIAMVWRAGSIDRWRAGRQPRDTAAMVWTHPLGLATAVCLLAPACALNVRRPPATPAAAAPAAAGAAEGILDEGAALPDVTALDEKGNPVSLSRYRGKPLVLYFYAMDFAAGATAQANEFRDDFAKYRGLGATIVGVSMDEPHTHRQFSDRHRLPFPLLSDPGGEVARALGVPIEAATTRHVTFLVDRQGVIRTVWRKVHPWGHSAQVLTELKRASAPTP
jgi:thioredoxin-dependent peroxiredoxin